MIEQMEEAVFLCDGDGSTRILNPAARTLVSTGVDPVGHGLLELCLPSIKDKVVTALDQLEAGGGRNVTVEVQAGDRCVLGSFTAIRDADGRISGLIVVCKDITDLKAMQSRLTHSSKMSAVGQLASGVAHEFNNLIAAIYGYAQFMKSNRDERVFHKGIEIILKSSERARNLTRSLLTFSRSSEGGREAADLNEILDDALLLVEQQLARSGIKVNRSYGRLPHLWVDRGAIQEAFLNLISNARHAMDTGGTLALSTRETGGSVVSEISDTGVGIPPEHIEKIFDPFFTTKGPLNSAKLPGKGLGLYTVYATVTAHGGRVEVSANESGVGTTVRLVLPIHTPRAEETPVRLDQDRPRKAPPQSV
jgi:signal transduction histidine kinase